MHETGEALTSPQDTKTVTPQKDRVWEVSLQGSFSHSSIHGAAVMRSVHDRYKCNGKPISLR